MHIHDGDNAGAHDEDDDDNNDHDDGDYNDYNDDNCDRSNPDAVRPPCTTRISSAHL
jgi:hypothetical protein